MVDNKAQGFQQVNIDGDDVDEWLYFFHYDGQGDKKGPIGGIIYDAQQDVDSQQPAAFFVPYRLLPDWREGKGQGYLGETSVAGSQARIDPNSTTASADELVVKGLQRRRRVDPTFAVSLARHRTGLCASAILSATRGCC